MESMTGLANDIRVLTLEFSTIPVDFLLLVLYLFLVELKSGRQLEQVCMICSQACLSCSNIFVST